MRRVTGVHNTPPTAQDSLYFLRICTCTGAALDCSNADGQWRRQSKSRQRDKREKPSFILGWLSTDPSCSLLAFLPYQLVHFSPPPYIISTKTSFPSPPLLTFLALLKSYPSTLKPTASVCHPRSHLLHFAVRPATLSVLP